MRTIPTAVLCHGCHLQADLEGKNWKEITFGDTGDDNVSLKGRVVMAIKVALDYDVKFIIFSTGASELDGLKEAAYTHREALSRVDKIALAIGCPETDVQNLLRQDSELDLESRNTATELDRNLRFCVDRGIERVILVSSAWHIPRCYRDAQHLAYTWRERGDTVPEIIAMGDHSDTEGLVIFEKPHRGDQKKHEFVEIFGQAYQVPTDRRDEFQNRQRALFAEFLSAD